MSTLYCDLAYLMEQNKTNEPFFSHLIVSYVLVGLVTTLAALFAFNHIDNELRVTPIIYEQALFELSEIESFSDQGAHALYAYFVNGDAEELMAYRKVVETIPSKFDSLASLTLILAPTEAVQGEMLASITQAWAEFTSNTEPVISEFRRTGVVSTTSLLSINQSLREHHRLIRLMIEFEHRKYRDGRNDLNKVIESSQNILLIVALVSLAALILVGALVTKQFTGFVSRQKYLNEDLRQRSATLYQTQILSENLAAELTQLIDTANAPIFGIDANGQINEWNQTAVKITGHQKEDVLGKNLVQEFITEDYRISVQEVLQNALQGTETSNYEFPLYTKEGARVDVLLNATTRRDVNGNVIGVIGVGQDITEVKLAQAALHQSQRLEVVGQLTGGVAHDFNNLLTVITGNLSFLRDELGVMSSDVTEIINDAQSAAKDGAELTNRLLAFARQQVLEPKATSVNDLIADTSRLMRRALGEDISITTVLDSKNPVVMVDQGQLESALMNLCINSRDAMQSGGSLSISSDTTLLNKGEEINDLTAGKYVTIAVEDRGSGMSENDIRQVFEPFYTTKEPGKGSGLGLSMVQGFVIQSQGTVVIESELGTGTIVKLYLPEVTGNAGHFPSTVGTASSKSVPNGTEKILVVDDEPRVRKTAVRVLRKLGYEVTEATSGEEALASMKKNKDIDLLFSDIMMPGGMNGRQLASIVKKEYPKIRIQLTTGYENVDITHDSTDADFPLLKKPYGQQDLAIALRKLLDK